jgi:hypothetical protein
MAINVQFVWFHFTPGTCSDKLVHTDAETTLSYRRGHYEILLAW